CGAGIGHGFFDSCACARAWRQEGVARRTRRASPKSEGKLRRADRHSLRRGARLGGCNRSAARHTRRACPDASVRFALNVESTLPHWRHSGLRASNRMAVVLVEKQTPQITLVTLNRPERRNSLTIELLTELVAAVTAASSDTQQRVLILRGAGAAF